MQTYLFDFDGTLVDSMPTFVSTMLRILDETGIPHPTDVVKTITPLGYAGTANYFLTLGVPLSQQEMLERMHRYASDAYLYHIPAKPNVIPVLQHLKAQGCSLNVLTASPHSVLDPCLKRLDIFHLFDHVWSCEDFGTHKADPAIYDMAAQRMGVPVECVLFCDDNYNADRTAKAAGMQVCGVYDPSGADFLSDMQALTDYFIDDFSQLLSLQ